MSWLSEFLGGGRKIRTPKVKPAEEYDWAEELEWGKEDYLRRLARKSGYEKTIKTGLKLPKLAANTYLGAR